MQEYKAKLEPESTYHIYNRANGNEQLFVNEENYQFFLQKYQHYITPIADTYCYCLLPNHFHFLVRIKTEKELVTFFKTQPSKGLKPLEGSNLPRLLSLRFSHLFNTYTQALNKQTNRKGGLFAPNFNRKKITEITYLRKLVHYIHFNPVETGLSDRPEQWSYSSYKALVSDKPTLIMRKELISWFENRENFIFCHQELPVSTGIDIY